MTPETSHETVEGRGHDVVVLGAGPAGLAAAWRAAGRGLSVVLVEREPRVGGLSASYDVAGVRVDAGSHRLHPATPPHVLAAVQELLGDDLQLRPRDGRLLLDGHWVRFPLRPADLLRALPPRLLATLARDAVTAPLRRPRADTYAEQVRAGLGPTALRLLYGPMAVKLWGLTPERVDGHQARVRVQAGSALAVVRRVIGRPPRGTGVTTHGPDAPRPGRAFFYPRRGYGQLSEVLADAAVAAGAEVRLSTSATSVRPAAGGRPAEVVLDDGQVLRAHRVLSTVPLPLLTRLIDAADPRLVDPSIMVDASSLRTRAVVLVHGVHVADPAVPGSGRWTSYDAHYLPAGSTPVHRVSEPASYRESADDPADRSVVTAEVPCDVGDDVWTADDDALQELLDRTLAEAGLPPLRRPASSSGLPPGEVRRLPHVYPVYDRGFSERLGRLLAWADGLDGVTTFGRLGLFAHDNSHHALVEGFDAGDALGPDGAWDAGAWSAARERFARHRVED